MPTPAITAAPHEMKWLGSGDYIHSIFMDKDGEAPQTRQAYASRTPTYPYIHARKRGKPMHHARPHIHTSMHANEASLCNTHDHISIHPCTQTRQAYATRTPTYPYIHARMYPHTHRHHFTLPEQYDCPIGMAQVRHDSTLFFVTATAIYAGSASESTNHVTQPEPPPIPIPTLTRPNPCTHAPIHPFIHPCMDLGVGCGGCSSAPAHWKSVGECLGHASNSCTHIRT